MTRHPSLGASSHGTRSQPEPPPAEIHSPALRGPHDEATGLRDQRAGTGPARWRILIFATLCAVCLAVAGGYIALAAQRAGPFPGAATTGPPEAAGSAGISSSAQTLDAILAEPHVVFRSTALGDTYGRVMLAALDDPNGTRYTTPLQCERVYFAAGQGLCLTADRGVFTTYRAILFDADFRPRHTFPLAGLPSRARLSPDGRYAAMTVFVSGHSYADGGFSTHTTIVETATGAQLGDLEQFTVLRDGAPIRSVDFNFWGITFARDSNRFYATLGTGGKTYLVEGDVAARQVRVLRDGVECPSLSPDGTRIAYKKRIDAGGRLVWQVAVLNLATLTETSLPLETHSVDDQVEWLDDQHVVYGLPAETTPPSAATNVWALPVDGSAPPRLVLANAWSPAVVVE